MFTTVLALENFVRRLGNLSPLSQADAAGLLALRGEVSRLKGNVDIVSPGHVFPLVARWIGLPAGGGQHFLLDTGTLCILGDYRGVPAIRVWNGPIGA